jgi:hypothetical protein
MRPYGWRMKANDWTRNEEFDIVTSKARSRREAFIACRNWEADYESNGWECDSLIGCPYCDRLCGGLGGEQYFG